MLQAGIFVLTVVENFHFVVNVETNTSFEVDRPPSVNSK